MTLKELAIELSNIRHANIPEHARPRMKFSDTTANELTSSILAYFHLAKARGVKCRAWRQPSEGRYLPEKWETNSVGHRIQTAKGIFIPRDKNAKGAGDILAICSGKFLSIEVKIGKDRQSDIQSEFQSDIEDSGGKYFIVRNWDSFVLQVKPWIK